MKILKIDLQNQQKEHITEAVRYLKEGSVVMHPTETCYGLAVNVFDHNALNHLYDLKKMPFSKPTSMMVRKLEEAKKYAEFNPLALAIARKFWPGPVTLVLPRKKSLPSYFNPGHETVGVRCPDSVLTQNFLHQFDGPLTTTSANVSGKAEVYKVGDFSAQCEQVFLDDSLLILDAGELSKNPPSTIVAFKKGKIVILREGELLQEIIMKTFLGKKGQN